MQKVFTVVVAVLCFSFVQAQSPKTWASSDILQQLKKLEVFGSVLYIAAHPDDENTRLLAYLANERRLRTGYMSITRGDGGQNLIGSEQGIDLGLIRTQELLAARRVDGAEQFFSTAFDFGYSKSPDETITKWGHDKILNDIVWVIRKFKPDVIISRFPTTGEGGHGHHTASAILASEAFDAAADSTMFPEQLKQFGITVWQAKRLLWNTFNFGGNNTQREDQLKIDVGLYNPILGKSYGEMAAESRSQHKSQGFGVPAQRGEIFEYFATIKGDKPEKDLMDGVETTVKRFNAGPAIEKQYDEMLKKMLNNFNAAMPAQSIPALKDLYDFAIRSRININRLIIEEAIAQCAGLLMEATAANQLNVVGDSLKFTVSFNNRSGVNVETAQVSILGTTQIFQNIAPNITSSITASVFIPKERPTSQPYWLEYPMNEGSFEVKNQAIIGAPESLNATALFQVRIGDKLYSFVRPIFYKYTDPVKGELYEPIQLVNPVFVNTTPSLIILSNSKKEQRTIHYDVQTNLPFNEKVNFKTVNNGHSRIVFDTLKNYNRGEKYRINVTINSDSFPNNTTRYVGGQFTAASLYEPQMLSLNKISYDHIPDIFYSYYDRARVIKMDLKTVGSRVGYIDGAGDKVPAALEQMGYTVVMLSEKDVSPENLKNLDAIITGVRAYNTNTWLSNVYDVLMNYVKEGGVLLVQYNTNNSIGPMKSKISPYPFNITRNRVTDETARVNFLLPDHPVLNYPNKITAKDFEGWIQERSIYNAENIDDRYQKILSMKDPGEKEQEGSLIVSNYGKGRFIYTGLVFFRELPAGVPGAYRLLANLIANNKK